MRVALSVDAPPSRAALVTELQALLLALLDRDLASIPGVVPDALERTAPGLQDARGLSAEPYRAVLSLTGGHPAFVARLQLCAPEGTCRELHVAGRSSAVEQISAAFVAFVADALGRTLPAEAVSLASAPVSPDPYAAIVCGRGAATFYGLRPPTPPELKGNRRRDPLARALSIDPKLSLCHWLSGRRALLDDKRDRAREALERATELEPGRTAYMADLVAVLIEPRPVEALQRLGRMPLADKDDLRFVLPRARALLVAGQASAAAAQLERLPSELGAVLDVLRLKVAIADAGGPGEDPDVLLGRWQQVAPSDPVPVRRRLELRVEQGRWEEALAFVPELEARALPHEARQKAIALNVALRRWRDAAQIAEASGDGHAAERLRLRAALEEGSAPPDSGPIATDPRALMARAQAALDQGKAPRALALAQRALAAQPGSADALLLKWKALKELGQKDEAARVYLALSSADPSLAKSPSTAAGASGSGVQAQSSPP